MANLLQFDLNQFMGFTLILMRMTGLMLSAPVLGDDRIPPQVRTGLGLILALLFFPMLPIEYQRLPPELGQMVLLGSAELAIGALMGFSAKMLFAGVSMAGEVIGFQMGVSVANVFDPSSGQQVALIGQLQYTFAMLLFVMLDGHHMLVRALVDSYAIVPPGAIGLSQPVVDHFTSLLTNIFVIGLQIGAPLVVSLTAANFAMGLVARSVPQMNIFVVGFPFTIALGLFLLVTSMPFFVQALVALHSRLEEVLLSGISLLR